MNKIHKPGLLSSNKQYFPKSKLKIERVSEDILFTTEILAGVKSPWKNIQGTITADNGYKWVRKYEVGKNYIIEKILNKSNELVALYIDICSPVEKNDNEFRAYDWYLDILVDIKSNEIVLDDEDEFNLAVEEGYLNKVEEGIARKTSEFLLKEVKEESFLDY